MEITWLGHSSIKIVSKDVVLITDPYPASIGFAMGSQNADIVSISNFHPNHCSVDMIGGNPRILKGPGQYEVKGYNITGVATKIEESEALQRTNTVYTYRSEGLSVCHLGDLNQRLTPTQVGGQGNVDVLIVPAGGGCTIDPNKLAEQVNVLGPKIVIPVHFTHEIAVDGLDSIDGFIKEFSVEDPSPQNRLNITQTNLPREPQVTILRKVS